MEHAQTQRRSCYADIALILLLFTVAIVVSGWRLFVLPVVYDVPSPFNPSPGITSPNLVASVMIATGRGFVVPENGQDALAWYPDAPELSRFLRREVSRIAAEDIPEGLSTQIPHIDWEYRHRYLVYTIGLLWRVFGISWHVVTGLRILFYGLIIVAVFGLMRLGMGRVCSVFFTLLLTFSPYILSQSHNVRDFSKGPFILFSMLLIGALIKYRLSPIALRSLSMLSGLLIGFGVGFRADSLICLPPAFVALACARTTIAGHAFRERLLALGLLCISFALPAYFIMGIYGGGGLFAHDVLMGFATKCDDMLGVNRSSYETVYVNDDYLVSSLSHAFTLNALAPGEYLPHTIDERPVLSFLIHMFPGDFLLRAYASVLWVLRKGVPSIHTGFLMFMATVVVLTDIARKRPWLAWKTLIFLLYFGGYLGLQPEIRHAFHLVFIPFWIVGVLVERLIELYRGRHDVLSFLSQALHSPRIIGVSSVRATLLFVFPAVLLFTLPLYALRAYQGHVVGTMLEAYTEPELLAVPVESREIRDWVMFERPLDDPSRTGRAEWPWCWSVEYWMAEFSPATQWRPIWLQYIDESNAPEFFTHGVWIAPSRKTDSGNIRYFFPVIEQTRAHHFGWNIFAGIALPQEYAEDFKGLYKVTNARDYPYFMNLTLPRDTTAFRRWKTLWGDTTHRLNAEEARYWLRPMPYRLPPIHGSYGNAEELMGSYLTGLETEPDNTLLRLGHAVLLESEVDQNLALETYRKALHLNPGFFVTYHYIDAFFDRCNDESLRLAFWHEISASYPENPLPLFHLGSALETAGDDAAAQEAFERVLRLNPYHPEALRAVARLLERQGNVDALPPVLKRILEIDWHDQQIVHQLEWLERTCSNN